MLCSWEILARTSYEKCKLLCSPGLELVPAIGREKYFPFGVKLSCSKMLCIVLKKQILDELTKLHVCLSCVIIKWDTPSLLFVAWLQVCKTTTRMKRFGGRMKCSGLCTHHQARRGDILVESFAGISYKYHVGSRKQNKAQKCLFEGDETWLCSNTCLIWWCKKKDGSLAKYRAVNIRLVVFS